MDGLRHRAFLIAFALAVVSRFWLPSRSVLAQAGYMTARNLNPSASRDDAAEGDWLSYRNLKSGLSFRYPPSLWVGEPDPAKLGLPDDSIVDLRGYVGLKRRHIIVLRFMCEPGEQTPETAAANAHAFLSHHQGKYDCAPVTSIRLDGNEAILFCSCGWGGSCQWTVYILQPRACSIFPGGPPAGPDDNHLPLHDGHFPLLSIIKTVHFESATK